jgi:hypothetical protein
MSKFKNSTEMIKWLHEMADVSDLDAEISASCGHSENKENGIALREIADFVHSLIECLPKETKDRLAFVGSECFVDEEGIVDGSGSGLLPDIKGDCKWLMLRDDCKGYWCVMQGNSKEDAYDAPFHCKNCKTYYKEFPNER